MGAPAIALINLPERALAGSPAVQLFFDWTRTILLNPSWDGGTLSSDLEGKRLTIRPSVWPSDPARPTDPLPEQIRVPYFGEPPRLLGYAPLATAQSVGVYEADLKRKWLGIRMSDAMTHPERLYFLQQDLASHPDFMLSWTSAQLKTYVQDATPEEVRKRIAPLDWSPGRASQRSQELRAVSDVLEDRIRQRGRPTPTSLRPFTAHHLDGLEDVTGLLRGALPPELSADWIRTEQAHEDFAAGRLANPSQFTVPGFYREFESVACDADSAYVMLYAELATGILELSGSMGPRVAAMQKFWAPMLNVTVRMQRLFLRRFDEASDPRCFRKYSRPSTPPLKRPNACYTRDIRAAGQDLDKLSAIMKTHSEHVQADGGQSCFVN